MSRGFTRIFADFNIPDNIPDTYTWAAFGPCADAHAGIKFV
jgi:hypothetical protein